MEDCIEILQSIVSELKLQQEQSELENVRYRQLISQYVVLEDKLIAGIETFENMFLRASDQAKLDSYIVELDKLTKEYQDEWDEEYWSLYKFRRGINTEISLIESPKRNRLSAKIDSFRTGGTIKISLLEHSIISTGSASEISIKEDFKPPVNSSVSFVDKKPPPPANSTISFQDGSQISVPENSHIAPTELSQISDFEGSQNSVAEAAPTKQLVLPSPNIGEMQAPSTELKHQSSSVTRASAKKKTTDKTGGSACCAGCLIS